MGGKVPGGRPEAGVDVSGASAAYLPKVPISLTSKALAGTLPSAWGQSCFIESWIVGEERTETPLLWLSFYPSVCFGIGS